MMITEIVQLIFVFRSGCVLVASNRQNKGIIPYCNSASYNQWKGSTISHNHLQLMYIWIYLSTYLAVWLHLFKKKILSILKQISTHLKRNKIMYQLLCTNHQGVPGEIGT